MKNVFKLTGFFALAVIATFYFAACAEESNGGNDSNSPYFGQTLTLTGQVWTYDSSTNTWAHYTGNKEVKSDKGGSGAITNGQLNFTIGTPTQLESITNFFYNAGPLLTDINISDLNTQITYLELRDPAAYILKIWEDTNVSEDLQYCYVDRDVTITAKGNTYIIDGVTYTMANINISLKAGWNATHVKYPSSSNNFTYVMSLNNPSHLRWYVWQ